jgi:twitching motility protein PilT
MELLTPAQRARLGASLDLDFAYAHHDAARFRASYSARRGGVGAVFRFVPARVSTLAELGSPDALRRIAERRSGIVLVSGPASSGRTTTAAAMIDHVNRTRACHILTIEDPLEFVHSPARAEVSHREVGTHGPSIAAMLESASRESADVILVSDLPDLAAIRLALDLANRGALVLATMPTTGAVATVTRVVTGFPEREQSHVRSMLADALAAVVSQQLVRAGDGKPATAVHEILVGSAAVSGMVRESRNDELTSVMRSGQAVGMQTMDMALERLVVQGRIGAEDALYRAIDREQFTQVVARVRPDLAENAG